MDLWLLRKVLIGLHISDKLPRTLASVWKIADLVASSHGSADENTHTHPHTHTHTSMRTHTHTSMHTHTHIHAHTSMRTHPCAHIHAHTSMRTQFSQFGKHPGSILGAQSTPRSKNITRYSSEKSSFPEDVGFARLPSNHEKGKRPEDMNF